jgi:Leucine-rich repeat (LRR) protein
LVLAGSAQTTKTGLAASFQFTGIKEGTACFGVTGSKMVDADGFDVTFDAAPEQCITLKPILTQAKVLRQGISASPNPSGGSLACTSVTANGTASGMHSATTDQNGEFRMDNLAIATYTVRASYPGYLDSETQNVTVNSSLVMHLETPTLVGGDVNGDGAVNILDIGTIVSKFGQAGVAMKSASVDCSVTDESSDINDDGLINISDLAITAGNWGKVETTGSITHTPTFTSTPTSTPTMSPTPCQYSIHKTVLSVSAENLKVGDTLKVKATLSNDGCAYVLGQPKYYLYIQTTSPESIFTPNNPPPVTHILGILPGESDTVEFHLKAISSGQATLRVGVSMEVHLGYPGGAYWGWDSSQEILVTVEPSDPPTPTDTLTPTLTSTPTPTGSATITITPTFTFTPTPTNTAVSDICTTVTEIPSSECNALVALYNSTNGSGWGNKTGWLVSNTPCSWFGITCSNGHVIEIFFNNNQLRGSIPSDLGNLTNLINLELSMNQLSGSIPAELGNLTNLMNLRLYTNQLTGGIPAELGSLTNLTELDLGGNQFTGNIPPELGNLTNLTYLYLGWNQFSQGGSGNQLTGSIPAELGSLTNLTELDLKGNQLTGSIPPELGDLTNLTYLDLGENQLIGGIPPELGNLTNLKGLSLHSNQLSGSIPPELGNLTNLTELWLNSNQLSGSIPLELGNLTNLKGLNLDSNQLIGNIPPELGNLTQMRRLYLDVNLLSGSIPDSLRNLIVLNDFTYPSTVCVPNTPEFTTWLDAIDTHTTPYTLCH